MTRDPRIDSYIARQADFARPILEHLRAAVHAACPDCEETLKWSMPTFMYKGQILASAAAFKAHATFGFWKGKLMESLKADDKQWAAAWGQYGRLTSLDDMPPDKVRPPPASMPPPARPRVTGRLRVVADPVY